MAIPSVSPSVRLSVTPRYCVKMTARSTVHFALSDSKMCLVLQKPKNIPQWRPLPPEILAQTDLPPPDSSKSWHVLPCSTSMVRASEKSSIMTGFPTSHQPRFYTAPNFLKRGIKYLSLLSFIQFWQGREVSCKVSLYKNCQRQSCSAINCLSSGIKYIGRG